MQFLVDALKKKLRQVVLLTSCRQFMNVSIVLQTCDILQLKPADLDHAPYFLKTKPISCLICFAPFNGMSFTELS